MSRRCGVWIVGGAAGLIHCGTALLRLGVLFPVPQLVDFGAFYAGAWALRLGTSAYFWSPSFLTELAARLGLSVQPSPPISPPVWLRFMQPLTYLSFGTAAWVWLGALLALTVWSALRLAQIAGCKRVRSRALVVGLVLTFGPIFLTLTLGQNSIFLLVAVLVVGRALRCHDGTGGIPAAFASMLAVAAKVIPLVWLVAVSLSRRWDLVAASVGAVVLAFGADALLDRRANDEYWLRFLPARAAYYSDEGGLEDQSLFAWIDRLGRPHSFDTSLVRLDEAHRVSWTPPWSFDPDKLRWASYVLVAGLALIPLAVIRRVGIVEAEGSFYLWVLGLLVAFPHTDRYNHVLLLPAMAWLWGRGGTAQLVVVAAYGLAALSRLTHALALSLPAPWGPLASGFGLYTVLLLAAGMVATLRPLGTEAG